MVSKEVKRHQLVTECADPELHDGNDQLPGANDAERNSQLIIESANPGLDVEDDQLPVADDQNQEPMVCNPPEEKTQMSRRPIRERRLIYDPASGTSTTPSG